MSGIEAIQEHERRRIEASFRDFAARLRAADDGTLVVIRELADREILRRTSSEAQARGAEGEA